MYKQQWPFIATPTPGLAWSIYHRVTLWSSILVNGLENVSLFRDRAFFSSSWLWRKKTALLYKREAIFKITLQESHFGSLFWLSILALFFLSVWKIILQGPWHYSDTKIRHKEVVYKRGSLSGFPREYVDFSGFPWLKNDFLRFPGDFPFTDFFHFYRAFSPFHHISYALS